MRRGRLLRPLLMSALSLCILLILSWLPGVFRPPAALAHAFVIGSDPVDGSTISTAPAAVRILFNTPLIPPAQLPQGSYTVRWTALSTTDGQATHGVIGFNVGHSSTGFPGQVILGPSTSNILPQLNVQGILAVAWDWLLMVALALWIGILVMEGVILAEGKSESGRDDGEDRGESRIRSIRKQSLPLQWLCLAALFIGEIIYLILRATLLTQANNNTGIDPVTIRELISDTTYGHLWLVRIALIGIALAFLWWTTRSTGRQAMGVRNTASSRIRGQARHTIVWLT